MIVRPEDREVPAKKPEMASSAGPVAGISSAPLSNPILRAVLELLVVFVGVYAAFALSEHESRKEALVRRQQLQSALVREIQDIISNTGSVAAQLPIQLAQFDSAVSAHARPALEPWIEPIRVDTHMWNVALESGALDLFDVQTVYEVSQFYNELNAGFEQLEQLRALSENVLIPNLDRPSDEFYDPATGRLRPKYEWYRAGLGRLSALAASITAMGESLVARLAAEEQT